MKILLIEDSNDKAKAVCDLLDKNFNHRLNIRHVGNLEEAQRLISDNEFDLYILDFHITSEKHGPKETYGLNILSLLKEKNKADSIIGYSTFDEISNGYKKDIEHIDFIDYNVQETNWEVTLIELINKHLKRLNIELTNISYDIAIITALSTEFDWMKKASKSNWIKNKNSNEDLFNFYTTKIYSKDKSKNATVVAYTYNDEMGMSYSSAIATKMIFKFKPKYLVMTGICAGNSEKVKKGDVILANNFFNYQFGDIRGDKFIPLLKNKHLDTDLRTIILATIEEMSYNTEIIREWEDLYTQNGQYPNIKDFEIQTNGTFATGSAIVKNKKLIENLAEKFSKDLHGLDMEAYSVMIASEFADRNFKTLPLIIKAVQDFADEEKDDKFRNFASFASARLFFKLCEDRLIDELRKFH